ncbi:MAG: molybdopterin-dependent oxidoreductase [Thermodesulfobacteriota bacterium]
MSGTSTVVKSACYHCFVHCGMLVHVQDGQVTKMEGDPENPVNKGKLCVKAAASIEILNHPDRLKYPLKRVGARGAGKWERVSWDEALDTIAGKLTEIKDNYGAESLFVSFGAIKGYQDTWLQRFANAFGTPNATGAGYICHLPTIHGQMTTIGFRPYSDIEHPSACVVVWGVNPRETYMNQHLEILEALDKGAKLIVINPLSIDLTGRADLWIRLRPGSDLALALSMMHVIINEELFDKGFVDHWTVGFDKLRAHVQGYPPEKVEGITWVTAQKIREAARMYATTRPACILSGNGTDQTINSFQAGRAFAILKAITGNLCTPGGDIRLVLPPVVSNLSPELALENLMKTRDLRASAGLNILKWPAIVREIPPISIVNAIVSGDPYPIRAGYLQGTNFLCTHANSQETLTALKNLELLVVADLFMTPTAELADFVLPVASSLEFDDIVVAHGLLAHIQPKVAEPVGESWTCYRILSELAKRLGLDKCFWKNEEDALDAILKPSGLTFQEFKKKGALFGKRQYKEYESNGFLTPSKKVEIFSSQLKASGFDPLPTFYEPPETPYSAPELAKEYPLVFTCHKSVVFRHSEGRQIRSLRELHPNPVIRIHAETAKKLGIQEGDRVYIETRRGRIKQKAALATDMDPRVVCLDCGWWFPEKPAEELHGWAESNINILTDNKPPYNREIGSTNLRGFLCKVYKVSE